MILTAREKIDDRLLALGLGADDYLTKPIDFRELTLRAGNMLARGTGAPRPTVQTIVVSPSAATMPPPAPAAAEKKFSAGLGAGLAVVFLAVIAAGGLIVGFDPGPDDNSGATAPASVADESSTAAIAVEPSAKLRDAAPSAKPDTPSTPSSAEPASETAVAAVRSKAEVLGYVWALDTQCRTIPRVPWWRQATHVDMVDYVVRKHGGDWKAYQDDLIGRLAKMYDIAERDSTAVTRTGERLSGDELQVYIQQSIERLDISRCLAREAKIAASPAP